MATLFTARRPLLLPLIAAFLAIFTILAAPAAQADESYPPVIQNLVDQGVKIMDHYAAAGDTTAYVGTMYGQAVAMYVTKDGQHVIIGSMLDEEGNSLTDAQLQKRVRGPRNQAAWEQLKKADWVLDGDKDAPTVVYAFTDPNCPYCHRFREVAAPWVDAGKVQIRHIVVGILGGDSPAKAATILGSDDPSAALMENQNNFRDGGIEVDQDVVPKGRKEVREHNQLMRSLGLSGTPSVYYKSSDGTVHLLRGLPRGADLIDAMGGPKP